MYLAPPQVFVPPPKPKSSSPWLVPVVLVGTFGLSVCGVSTCLVRSIRSRGSNPDEVMKSLSEELENERRKLESQSSPLDDRTSSLADAAPPEQRLDSYSAQNRTNEDAGAGVASSPAGTDASPGDAIDPNDPTLLDFDSLLWMREPIKDPRTGKPAKYASLRLAEAACSQRPGVWRLPSVREFRMLTKDGRINDMFFPDYPTGAFWATPDDRVAISAAGRFDSYDGPAPPMALCVKEYTPERIFPDEP